MSIQRRELGLSYLAAACGAAVAVIGGTGLAGWLLDNHTLKSLLSGGITMKTNAAIGLMLVGMALALSWLKYRPAALRVLTGCWAGGACIIGALTLLEYLSGWDLWIDQLLFEEVPGVRATASPNRMGPPAAVALFLSGGVLLYLVAARQASIAALQGIGLATFLVGLFPLMGHAYDDHLLYNVAGRTNTAMHTAVALALLGIGLVVVRPGGGFVHRICEDTPGGLLLRRFLPVVLLLPLLLGWVHTLMERHNVLGPPAATSFVAVVTILALLLLLWWNADTIHRSQFALRESEERFRSLAEAMPNIVFISRPGGHCEYVNRLFYEYTGLEDGAGLGHGWRQAVHPADFPRIEAVAQQAHHSGTPYELRYRLRRADGTLRWLMVRSSPLRDASGRIVKWIGTSVDIEDIVRAEALLRESEAKFRLMGETIPYGIWMAGPDGRLLYVSPSLLEFLGKTLEEVRHEGWAPSLAENEDAAAYAAAVAHSVRTGEDWDRELRVRGADGTCRVLLSRGKAVRDAGGEITSWVGINLDVTARREAELELEQTIRKLRLAQLAAQAGTWEWELWTGAVRLSDEYRVLCGLPSGPQPETYEAWLETVHPDDRPAVNAAAAGIRERYEDVQIEFRIIRADGEARWLQSTGRLQFEGATPVRMIGIAIDVTERKQAEMALERQARELERRTAELTRSNAELEQFAYVVSHDLRSPLVSIGGCTQLLTREVRELTPEGRELLAIIQASTARLSELIRSLLDYSRIGSRQISAEACDLNNVVAAVCQGIRSAIGASDARIEIERLPVVRGDKVLLSQVFQNLIENAIKYRRQNPVEISISGRADDSEAVLTVRDNGIGIDPSHFSQLFQVFRRLHGENSPYPGAGVGLAICKRIIERHGGRIWLESQPGEGTSVHFSLPMRPPAEPPQSIPLATAQPTG